MSQQPVHRILVTVAGHQVDEETVRMACRMATRGRGEAKEPAQLYAVHVIEVNRSLPLSAPVEGQANAWSATDPLLEGKGLSATVRVRIGDKSYEAKIEHKKAAGEPGEAEKAK